MMTGTVRNNESEKANQGWWKPESEIILEHHPRVPLLIFDVNRGVLFTLRIRVDFLGHTCLLIYKGGTARPSRPFWDEKVFFVFKRVSA